ncbi:UDP-N-acetylmuramate--L-alanine ligase protein [Dioscorea alata]|uniref:UDP-N-acetylmuramate--L-alanine ligase protein n=1 Tax=Dioscorea alata TaxID=55571 RepID=A0ACB7V6F5_DIOAL|nr:UDP-N-acetylmuramate--L-alanine ligase protein [Dioscorea alata]
MSSFAFLATTNACLPINARPNRDQCSRRLCLAVTPCGWRRLAFTGGFCSTPEGQNNVEICKESVFEVDDGEKRKKEWVHFVGIGGSGLSALAMLALQQGFDVSGSDIMWSSFLDKLHEAGARLHIGHSASNLKSGNGARLPDAIVVSSAVPSDNEEVVYANSVGIPIYKRDLWLGKITEQYNLIAISGTHGKSTTTAMLSYVLNAMGDNLISVVGANVPQFAGGNIIAGKGPNFVLEADEYDKCFLALAPQIAVVTNVNWDHVDTFPNEEAIKNAFREFVHQIRPGGHLILCGDSPGACDLLVEDQQGIVPDIKRLANAQITNQGYYVTTYGISSKNDWHASSITSNLQGGRDYVLHHKGCPVANISLMLTGDHNVLNSLAVIATITTMFDGKRNMHDTINAISHHLAKFEGVSRRFDFIGKVNGCHIYDDYAHHPAELRALLRAARQKFPSQALWVVFQPHTYSRLAAFMEDFITSFTAADHVIVTEIYAARETDNGNFSGRDLATSIIAPSSEYIPKMDDVIDLLETKLQSSGNQDAIVFTVGAGDITTLGPKLLARLQQSSCSQMAV